MSLHLHLHALLVYTTTVAQDVGVLNSLPLILTALSSAGCITAPFALHSIKVITRAHIYISIAATAASNIILSFVWSRTLFHVPMYLYTFTMLSSASGAASMCMLRCMIASSNEQLIAASAGVAVPLLGLSVLALVTGTKHIQLVLYTIPGFNAFSLIMCYPHYVVEQMARKNNLYHDPLQNVVGLVEEQRVETHFTFFTPIKVGEGVDVTWKHNAAPLVSTALGTAGVYMMSKSTADDEKHLRLLISISCCYIVGTVIGHAKPLMPKRILEKKFIAGLVGCSILLAAEGVVLCMTKYRVIADTCLFILTIYVGFTACSKFIGSKAELPIPQGSMSLDGATVRSSLPRKHIVSATIFGFFGCLVATISCLLAELVAHYIQ